MADKAPSFQWYPDKWLAGTKHLSDEAARAYIDLLCWMWLHGKGHCRMPNTDHGWSVATGLTGEALEIVRAEIMHAEFAVLKVRAEFCFSNGLAKEARKQRERKAQARNAAKMRWDKKNGKQREQCGRNASASSPQCLPSPSSSPTPSNNKHTEEGAREEVDGLEIGGIGAPPKVQATPGQVMAFQAVWYEAFPPTDPANPTPLKDSWLDAVTNKWRPEFTGSITVEALRAAKAWAKEYLGPNKFLDWLEEPGKKWKGGKKPVPKPKPRDPHLIAEEGFKALPQAEQDRRIEAERIKAPDAPPNSWRVGAALRWAEEQK